MKKCVLFSFLTLLMLCATVDKAMAAGPWKIVFGASTAEEAKTKPYFLISYYNGRECKIYLAPGQDYSGITELDLSPTTFWYANAGSNSYSRWDASAGQYPITLIEPLIYSVNTSNGTIVTGPVNLRRLKLPNVGKPIQIADNAFGFIRAASSPDVPFMTHLEEIDLNNSTVTIGNAAFANSGVKKVIHTNGNLVLQSGCFTRCSHLTQLGDTENTITLGDNMSVYSSVFSDVENPTANVNVRVKNGLIVPGVEFRGENTSGATVYGYRLFANNQNIRNVAWEAREVCNAAFQSCRNIETIFLSENTVLVRDYAFNLFFANNNKPKAIRDIYWETTKAFINDNTKIRRVGDSGFDCQWYGVFRLFASYTYNSSTGKYEIRDKNGELISYKENNAYTLRLKAEAGKLSYLNEGTLDWTDYETSNLLVAPFLFFDATDRDGGANDLDASLMADDPHAQFSIVLTANFRKSNTSVWNTLAFPGYLFFDDYTLGQTSNDVQEAACLGSGTKFYGYRDFDATNRDVRFVRVPDVARKSQSPYMVLPDNPQYGNHDAEGRKYNHYLIAAGDAIASDGQPHKVVLKMLGAGISSITSGAKVFEADVDEDIKPMSVYASGTLFPQYYAGTRTCYAFGPKGWARVDMQSNRAVSPFKWIVYEAKTDTPNYGKLLTYSLENITAGVSHVDVSGNDDIQTNAHIYNMMGVRMTDHWNSLPKGMYIVNGKKIIKND